MRKYRLSFGILILAIVLNANCKSYSQQQAKTTYTPGKTKSLEIHVIDVGQGDCFLIISPSGKKILIDAGNNGKGEGVVVPYLNKLGVASVDYIIASHFHSDHIGGLDEVVNSLGGSSHIIGAAFDRGGTYNSGTFGDYIMSIGDKRKTILPGQFIDIGDDASMNCIASNGSISSGLVYSGTDENALSVVLVLRFHFFDMYFGGDSSLAIEPSLAPFAGDVDVYKVSHHGSRTSSCQQLLDYLKPEISVIAVGNGNTYGHPNPETISRLVTVNSFIYQTESGAGVPPIGKGEVANGNFTIVTDGDSYTISGASLVSKTRLTDSKLALLKGIESCLRFWPFSIF
jgi:competence protein ComEC